jgi:aryl-alcohol dehydrogenase-like predicted oxidoreductase
MRVREFGTSGLKTSVIGFGGWPLGKGQYGALDDQQAIAAVQAAYEGGITLFDTATAYGWGSSEALLGKAVKAFRKDIVLVTKGGRRRLKDLRNRTLGEVSDSSPRFLNEGIDGSLRRLATDYIDLYLIHWPDPTRSIEVAMGVLEEARASGKIQHYGVSNFSGSQLAESMMYGRPICNQVGYHILDRRPEHEIVPFAQAHNIGIMAYGSLAHGLLSGEWVPGQVFGSDDWRRAGRHFGLSTWAAQNLPKNLAFVERLRSLAAEYGKTIAQLAIAWVLAHPVISVALCGARSPLEIRQDLGGDWEMPSSLRNEIDRLAIAEAAGFGRAGDLGP